MVGLRKFTQFIVVYVKKNTILIFNIVEQQICAYDYNIILIIRLFTI